MTSRFVILGIQRTGTTWIRTTLDSHPAILTLGEVFLHSHGRFPFRRKAGLDVQQNYRSYIEKSARRRVQHWFNRPALVADYLQHLYTQPGYDAIGFKLMRTHCKMFPTVVPYLLDEKVPAIHVVRRNVLKTLISRESARQRKLFHAKSDVPVKKIKIDVASLLPTLERIAADNQEWETIFRNARYLQVSYESFVSNKELELRRMYEFISVKPDVGVSSNLVKINPDSIKDVVINYDEICRALENTRFSCFLDQ
jgi:hypothetical protein